ncbi:TlpA family protein disulfide reductase [Flavobacterium sp. AS60]|uniref:TlpA family protein disulfide reductase n=1 Tax=Flavobacterium anseongense TaxID=2910677 RepID=UPI001F1F2AC1|nr:TlpA disulfide reductase family protein [Flavobacterium sp. AS60]MCF6129370.1 TlpA family protein disulfide reductase [Flavobacterium sp. AS60]
MKKLYFILVAFVFSSIGFAQKNTMTFQADIANRNGDVIYIKENKNTIQEIKIDKDNLFKATFEVKEGLYLMFDGVEYTQLFLKNGYNLKLKMDAKNFDASIKYTGKGEAENNFLAQSTIEESTFNYNELLAADEASFNKMIDAKRNSDFQKLDSAKLDSNFVALQKQNIDEELFGLRQYYNQKLAGKKMNNSKAPNFDYENHAGGKTTLESLKGKYVYIDLWATWCGPCRAEIPFLKELEKSLHDKNIAFVSISTDSEKDHEKWRTFVKEKELTGIQLYADRANMDFIKAFNVNTIPRFILIDPTGTVVDADAARPSDPKLKEQLAGLLQ